jgi:hypothetical protein
VPKRRPPLLKAILQVIRYGNKLFRDPFNFDFDELDIMVSPIYRHRDTLTGMGSDLSSTELDALLSRLWLRLEPAFSRAHAVVLGPGLGRSPFTQMLVERVAGQAIEGRIP